jgi:hypothetical protein
VAVVGFCRSAGDESYLQFIFLELDSYFGFLGSIMAMYCFGGEYPTAAVTNHNSISITNLTRALYTVFKERHL